jgi:hypothetical protein
MSAMVGLLARDVNAKEDCLEPDDSLFFVVILPFSVQAILTLIDVLHNGIQKIRRDLVTAALEKPARSLVWGIGQ